MSPSSLGNRLSRSPILRQSSSVSFPLLWNARRHQSIQSHFMWQLQPNIFSSVVTTTRPRQIGTTQRRYLSRSSLDGPETPFDKAVTFVVSVGYEQEVARGVVDALQQSGLSGEALLSVVRQLAGRWEVGEDAGLEALAASVKQDIAAKRGQKVKIIVVPPNAWDSAEDPSTEHVSPCWKDADKGTQNRAFSVEAYEGMSVTDVAKFGTGEGADTLGEYLECACSGIMACSTCHVIVDSDWFGRVGAPNEDEQDMIDLAYGPRPTSRLGCQIVLTPDLDGVILYLPKGQNNIMDHIPFEG